jgi:hypothetical protein
MEYYRRLSPLRPEPGETLMSFLRRSQIDAGASDEEVHSLVAGVSLPDARAAERRPFDWESLSRFLNATPVELYIMSERSFFCEAGDEKFSSVFARRAPWVRQTGYSAHCPCCLRRSPHWRRSWLTPDALVCPEHGTLLLRHCHACGADLGELKWSSAAPICPSCGAHLSLGPVVSAPSEIVRQAAGIRQRFSAITASLPVNRRDYNLAHFAAVWRAARILASESDRRLWPLRDAIHLLSGVGPLAEGCEVADRALRYVQIVVVAHSIAELEPTFAEYFWLATGTGRRSKCDDPTVYFKLLNVADSLELVLPAGPVVCGQLMMSFASWEGVKSLSIAA